MHGLMFETVCRCHYGLTFRLSGWFIVVSRIPLIVASIGLRACLFPESTIPMLGIGAN